MAGCCIGLRTEVLQINPSGLWRRCDGAHHCVGQVTAERFDNDVGGMAMVPWRL